MTNWVEGRLFDYSEQGWEAEYWLVLEETGRPGHEGMHRIAPGDWLTVFDEKDNVVFDGEVPPWTTRYVLAIIPIRPRLPEGFFDWFRVKRYRARMSRNRE